VGHIASVVLFVLRRIFNMIALLFSVSTDMKNNTKRTGRQGVWKMLKIDESLLGGE
jgi:hypothetical protein